MTDHTTPIVCLCQSDIREATGERETHVTAAVIRAALQVWPAVHPGATGLTTSIRHQLPRNRPWLETRVMRKASMIVGPIIGWLAWEALSWLAMKVFSWLWNRWHNSAQFAGQFAAAALAVQG